MVQCAIKGCRSRSDIHINMHNKFHFHRIPKHPEVRKKWMQATNIDSVKNGTRICSNHFREQNYYITPLGLSYLLCNAVPEINLNVSDTSVTDSSDDEKISQPKSVKQPENKHTLESLQPDSSGSVDSLRQNSNHQTNHQFQQQQSSTKDITPGILTTVNVNCVGSTASIEPGVQIQTPVPKPEETRPSAANVKNKVKIKTPLEKKLLLQVKKLQELSKKRLEAINCLEEQNRRLLKRNSFLQEALDDYEKVPQVINNAVQREYNFF